MIKQKLKNVKGITLTSLAITIIVLMILTSVVIYNIADNLKTQKLVQLQSDIKNLRDKVSNYYMETGSIPAKCEYTNTGHIDTISEVVDTGKFLVLDLSAIDNLTLNYGKDYENIKKLENFKSGQELASQDIQNNTDLYIINETSHNIFYVEGIQIDGETYYTDYTKENVDKESVELKYINGIKIPEGFNYISGTKDTGIIIQSNDATEQYQWTEQKEEITEIPNNITLENGSKNDFIKSVNNYKGYYKSTSGNQVVYLSTDNWSPQYDKEGIYKDKNEDTVSIPKGFYVSTTPGENTINEGLVAKDTNQNEWVWIEVPKNLMPGGLTFNSESDYTTLIKELKTYANPYTKGNENQDYDWKDEWYALDTDGTVVSASTEGLTDTQKQLKTGCGLTYDEYKENYHKMLRSIYNNGGFWIGRYEAGIEGSTGTDEGSLKKGRTSSSARIEDISTSTKAISQKDAIPYNFVTCSEAQTLANAMAPDDSKTSSLLFGIQWDLVCKFIEEKEVAKLGEEGEGQRASIVASINSDSKDWGNYKNVSLNNLSSNAKSFTSSWSNVSGDKTANNNILLSTGASEKTKRLNIYDFAGNEFDWTLEHALEDDSSPCSGRGGNFSNNSPDDPVSSRGCADTTNASFRSSFRPALY